MRLSEARRLSKVAYAEVVYRPALRSGYLRDDKDPRKVVRSSLRGATLNKLIFAAFTLGGAGYPFVLYKLGIASTTLAVGVALSIILVFGYTVLYAVQVLPSFVSSGSFAPLEQMPLVARETSLVAVLTLWRTLDVILVLAISSQIIAVAFLTRSVLAVLVMLLGSFSGEILAVALALWLVSTFQRRLEGSPLTGSRSFFRPVVFVLWGLSVMGAVFLFTLASFAAPALTKLMATPDAFVGRAVSLAFPFSAGLLVSTLRSGQTGGVTLALASTGMVAAAGLSALAARGAYGIIGGLVRPNRNAGIGRRLSDLTFRLRSPLSAYVRKDLRVASRSPATGFLFALPVFEIISVVVPLTATSIVKASSVLVAAQVGGGFALFTAFLLVTVEDLGIERQSALPLSQRVRTLSKVLVSTVTYFPVPCILAVILLYKSTTFVASPALPFIAMLAVFSACTVEVRVLRRLSESGRGAAVRFALGIGSGLVVLMSPAIAYFFVFVGTSSHWLGISSFSLVTLGELVVAASILRSEP